jgi:hypothetical protein
MPELDGEVFVLNGNNFASTLANHDVALVKFYAPWYVGRLAHGAMKACAAVHSTSHSLSRVLI